MNELEKLASSMNFDGKRVAKEDRKPQWRFVTADHRAIMAIVWAAFMDGLWKRDNPPLLLRWDAHEDFVDADPPAHLQTFWNCPDHNSALAFANDLHHDDSSWAYAAVQTGAVGNMGTFFVAEHSSPAQLRQVKDLAGRLHEIAWAGRFSECLVSQGALRSGALPKFSGWASAVGWNHQTGWDAIDRPLWLDIDLDFATHPWMPQHFRSRPWDLTDYSDEFRTKLTTDGPIGNGIDLWRPVFEKADLITISTEPSCSLGYEGVASILVGLNRVAPTDDWFSWCSTLRPWNMK